MGDTGLQHQHLQQREDGAEHSGAGCSVADTENHRHQPGARLSVDRECLLQAEQSIVRRGTGGPGEPGRCCADVADTSSQRRQQNARSSHGNEGKDAGWSKEHDHLTQGGCAGIFAPGPADPAWPGIIQHWPHLAPALAGESGSARLNPCFVEFLMGWPIFWTHINVDQTDDQKASAARSTNEWRTLLQMRLSEWFDAPSLGLQQATGSGNHVPVLPRETPRGGNEAEISGLQDLQGTVHANPHKALGHLPKTGMQSGQGRGGCSEAMGQQTADGSMQLLPSGVHENAATPDNVRQVVREQVGMAEQAMSNRPQRLKCCGNGVVAAQASFALVGLVRRMREFQ